MSRRLLLIGLALAIAALTDGQDQPENRNSPQATVNRYCLGCHNDKLKSGNFNWAHIDLDHPAQSAAEVEKAVRMLRAGMMPPPGMPRPDAA